MSDQSPHCDDAPRTDAPASAPTPPTQCASIGPDWRERSTGRLMRGCRCLLPDGHEGQHTRRHYEAFKAGGLWVPLGPPWAPPHKDDTWGDAPASGEASATPPPLDGEVLRWQQKALWGSYWCAVDAKGNSFSWVREGRWWRPTEANEQTYHIADEARRRLAERLAAVEAEVAALAKRAYKEGWIDADSSPAGASSDAGWEESSVRADLNERERRK